VRERLRAYQEAGIRVAFGLDIRNRNHVVYGDEEFIATLPPALQERARHRIMQPRTANAEDYVRLVGELSNELGSNPEDRVKIFLTPAGPQWCTEELLQVIRRLSDERRLGIQIHVLETKYQRAYFLRKYGKSAVEWLDELGFLAPQVSLAHGVWLSERDIGSIARRGSAVGITRAPTCV
jgi:5-methylthioadenosine/S-adenosylhomocysteine deaminase